MILLMGIAGSGKGTQGKLIAKRRGCQVISTGEILRTYGTEDQYKRMLKGEILKDEEVTELLNRALQQVDEPNKIILDGYPRRVSQANWLLQQAREGHFSLECVLHLIASPGAVKTRLRTRGRLDDHDKAIEARFAEYEQQTLPILSHLKQAGIKIIEIDGERAIEEVYQDISVKLG